MQFVLGLVLGGSLFTHPWCSGLVSALILGIKHFRLRAGDLSALAVYSPPLRITCRILQYSEEAGAYTSELVRPSLVMLFEFAGKSKIKRFEDTGDLGMSYIHDENLNSLQH
jgi:hypothetical protein